MLFGIAILSELILGLLTFGAAGFDGAGLGNSTFAGGGGFDSSAGAGRSLMAVRMGVDTEMLSLCSDGTSAGFSIGAGVGALTTGLAEMDCLRGSSAAFRLPTSSNIRE